MNQPTLTAEQQRILSKGPLPDYPFTPQSFRHPNGLLQSYLDEGPRGNETLVLIHGNPSWSYYWRRLVLNLRDKYRCIVPDHIGMGLSEKPSDRRYQYTLQSRVDDLSRLLEHADIGDNVTLIVHDWGGMIGMGWALKHAHRIKRLVFTNTAAFTLPTDKPLPWQLKLGRDYNIGALLIRGFNAFAAGAASDGVMRKLSADERKALLAPYDSWKNRISTLRFVQDIPLSEKDRAWSLVAQSGERLPQFADRPVFLGWGLKDFVFDHHFLSGFQRALPNAETLSFEDAGHYVLEDKHEQLVPAIRAFLDKHPV
jgi:cis-3-alkyl-4-acyloxetan-2-one decarboxylase